MDTRNIYYLIDNEGKYPIESIVEYISREKIKRGETAEQTLNRVLERLQKDPQNKSKNIYTRPALVSACTVALMGLGKIKDPAALLENLGKAFGRRSYCIHGKTSKLAFGRLIRGAIGNPKKKGIEQRLEKVAKIIKKFENNNVRGICILHLPEKTALKHFGEAKIKYSKYIWGEVKRGLWTRDAPPHELMLIHGKRGKRTRTMHDLTRRLRA